jgi:NitT/TauT family transport system ATP-binding protein
MDEPFAALDAQTRLLLEEEFVRIWELERPTVIFVTHDLAEAVSVADRVLVMSSRPGSIKLERRVPLERPRDLETIRFDPAFVELQETLWEALRDEYTAEKSITESTNPSSQEATR